MPLLESKEDRELRTKIAAEEKEKFDKRQKEKKERAIREHERAKLESGGTVGMMLTQGKKLLKDVLK